jgi:hypothetical protein
MALNNSYQDKIVALSKLQHSRIFLTDFCLIPIGTPTASVSHEIAAVQRLLKKSGVNYSMHSAGTVSSNHLISPTPPNTARY